MPERDEAALRRALVAFGASFFARGMAVGTAGNLSVRLDDGWLVTPTNSSLGRLEESRLSRLDRDWQPVSGDPPTKEVAMHRAFYETRPGTEAVVHLHSTHAAAVSFLADLPELDPIPPFSPYFVMRVGHLPVVPYLRPGSPAIGEAIRAFGGRYRSVLLRSHGPVVAGASLEEAVASAEELEETARLYLMLRPHGLRVLSAAECAELARSFRLDW